MKLRRAMAVAAATAVIAPAAFLAAPAAYADPSPAVTESTSTTAPSTPAEEETTPAPTETATTTPAPTETAVTTPAPTSPAPTETATVSPSPSETSGEEEPVCEDFADNADVHTELLGLPSKVVAGSGWVEFTYRVTNESDKDFDAVEAYIDVAAIGGEDFEDSTQFLKVQWLNGGEWTDITDEMGYFGTTDALKPNDVADAKMRLKVDAKAPAGYGFAATIGVHIGGDGTCEFGEWNEFEFDILAAGSEPGEVDDAEGKPGKGNKPTPQGELQELPVTGNLAETGSSSVLPAIGIAGGVAVVAGAGVVFAMKRRKGDAIA
ncbi:LPXTG cell wall anchor domain-containing protein [Streptomyces sp. NPDC006678]|uniref:LPXTG cell wall anchor domain-containing protein n=1 Tax=Streptomyces sp. NPDC006678 TaxID=3157185 RepID=UPI0033D84209